MLGIREKDINGTMEKILIVAPHFPPSALPPSQRARLLVNHLIKNDITPIIITVKHNKREEISDDWLSQRIPIGIDCYFSPCISQKITRKFYFGDLGLRMLPGLLFSLLKIILWKRPKFILFLVPPWYILTIAPILKKITGIKYGINFIDPWVYNFNEENKDFKKKFSSKIALFFEGWVCRNADIIFSVSEQINNNIKLRYPETFKIPFNAIPYGAEVSDFNSILPLKDSKS